MNVFRVRVVRSTNTPVVCIDHMYSCMFNGSDHGKPRGMGRLLSVAA